MKTAVVMSTYNGERYITEQLESIYRQTVSVDEVIISDDCSTDGTPNIVRDYIKSHNLNAWHFSVNKNNVGWKKNFFRLIDECDADVIFLADQDDIWNIHKIEIMSSYFKDNNIELLFCGVDKEKNIKTSFDYSISKKSCIHKQNFSEKYLWGIPTFGCCFAFRKTFFEKIKPFHSEILPHDAFLYRNAILNETCYRLNQKLIIHRLHDNNAGKTTLKSLRESIDYYRTVNKLMLDYLQSTEIVNKSKKIKIIKKTDNWLNIREKFYKTRNPAYFFKLLRYWKYYPHFKTFIKELFIAYKR